MSIREVILLLYLLTLQNFPESSAQDCLRPANTEDSLPNFESRDRPPQIPDGNGAQAIVTGYQFHCCGNITAWQTYVSPNKGAHRNRAYSINFQVWRPSPTVGSDGAGEYSLVGENRFTSITFANNDPVSETPEPTSIIPVRPGDVVGFFQFSNVMGPNDGIQLENMSFSHNHLLWYQTSFQQGSVSTLVAGNGGALISSTNAGIQLSVDISTSQCTALPSPTPSSTEVPPTELQPTLASSTGSNITPSTTNASPTEDVHTQPMEPLTPQSHQLVTPTSATVESDRDSTNSQSSDFGVATTATAKNNSVASGLAAGLVVVIVALFAITAVVAILYLFSRKKRKVGTKSTVNGGVLERLYTNHLYGRGSRFRKRARQPFTNITDHAYSTIPYTSLDASGQNTSLQCNSAVGVSTGEGDIAPEAAVSRPGLPRREAPFRQCSHDIELTEITDKNYSLLTFENGANIEQIEDNYTLIGPEYAPAIHKLEEIQSALYSDTGYENDYEMDTHKVPQPSAGKVVPNQSDRVLLSETEKKPKSYSQLDFFTKDPIYWTPSNSTSELYDQLAFKKYREIPRNQIKILGHLGSGQFGSVSKGLWTMPTASLTIAVKQTLAKTSSMDRVKLLQEAAIMGQFSHPYVVKIYGLVTIQDPLMICTEYMGKGDLESYLTSLDLNALSKEAIGGCKDVRYLFLRASCEIAAGMRYLAGKSFIHRDLAARNVLLTDTLTCKIGDFGMARDLTDENYYKAQDGSKIPVKWTAPEAIYYKKYSTDSDVWSYGMVLFEIWSMGKNPFSTMSNVAVIKVLEKGYCQAPPPGCPRAIYKLMVDCWNPQHHLRPKFAEICNYLQQPVSKLLYWSPHDSELAPSVDVIGAPLNCAFKLYLELQEHHLNPDHKYY